MSGCECKPARSVSAIARNLERRPQPSRLSWNSCTREEQIPLNSAPRRSRAIKKFGVLGPATTPDPPRPSTGAQRRPYAVGDYSTVSLINVTPTANTDHQTQPHKGHQH